MLGYAYVPYSRYPVGAAALVDDGRVVTGCNVENASYGLTLCAECGLVSALAAGGGGRLVAFACVDGTGAALMPCGRCRQLLWEHGGPELPDRHPGGHPADDRRAAAGLRPRPPPHGKLVDHDRRPRLLRAFPKVSLHDHLDGALRPQTILELAARDRPPAAGG